MSKVVLHGKSLFAMLSSFACANSGHHGHAHHQIAKDRLVTVLIVMSCIHPIRLCAADWACIPGRLATESLTMLSMYLLGIVVAVSGIAWILKKHPARRHTNARNETAALQEAAVENASATSTSAAFPAPAGTVILKIIFSSGL